MENISCLASTFTYLHFSKKEFTTFFSNKTFSLWFIYFTSSNLVTIWQFKQGNFRWKKALQTLFLHEFLIARWYIYLLLFLQLFSSLQYLCDMRNSMCSAPRWPDILLFLFFNCSTVRYVESNQQKWNKMLVNAVVAFLLYYAYLQLTLLIFLTLLVMLFLLTFLFSRQNVSLTVELSKFFYSQLFSSVIDNSIFFSH